MVVHPLNRAGVNVLAIGDYREIARWQAWKMLTNVNIKRCLSGSGIQQGDRGVTEGER
jgi:hypothetical protein